jgi:peptidyl-prolyl cis-trans isomerase SurA
MLGGLLSVSPTLLNALTTHQLFDQGVSAKVIDRVVAVVNDEVVTLSELQELTLPFQMRLQSVADPLKRSELMREQELQALDQLISQRLIVQVAREQGVKVSDEQVEGHLQSVMRQQGWGEAELAQYLAAQGMTREQLKKQSYDFLLQQSVTQRNLAAKVQVSESDLEGAYRDYLTEAKAEARVEGAHIILPVPAGSDAAAEAATKQLAQELLTRAQNGESFEELAREHSKGPGASDGGDLGVITRGGGLPKSLEDAFFKLKEGEVSGPIRSPFGYHVIKVTRLATQAPPSLEAVRPQLEAQLRQSRFQEALQAWIEKLKTSAFIERKL